MLVRPGFEPANSRSADRWNRREDGHNSVPRPVFYRPLMDISIMILSLPLLELYIHLFAKKQALHFDRRGKCAARECARAEMEEGRKECWHSTDQTWFLATLSEDRFLCLWEITHCRMCGCFQGFNLEALSPCIVTEKLTVKAEGSVM